MFYFKALSLFSVLFLVWPKLTSGANKSYTYRAQDVLPYTGTSASEAECRMNAELVSKKLSLLPDVRVLSHSCLKVEDSTCYEISVQYLAPKPAAVTSLNPLL